MSNTSKNDDHSNHVTPTADPTSSSSFDLVSSEEISSVVNKDNDSRKLRPRNDKTDYNEDKTFQILFNQKLENSNNNNNHNDNINNNENNIINNNYHHNYIYHNSNKSSPKAAHVDKRNQHYVVVYNKQPSLNNITLSNESSHLEQLLNKELGSKKEVVNEKEIPEPESDCIDEENYFRYLNLVSNAIRKKNCDDYFKTTWPLRMIARSRPIKKMQPLQHLQLRQKQQQEQLEISANLSFPKREVKDNISILLPNSSSISSSQSKIHSTLIASSSTLSEFSLENDSRLGRQFLAKQNWKNQVRAFNQNLNHDLNEKFLIDRHLNNHFLLSSSKNDGLQKDLQISLQKLPTAYQSSLYLNSSNKSPSFNISHFHPARLKINHHVNQVYPKFSNHLISKPKISL